MAKRRKFTDEQIEEIKRLRDTGMSKVSISKACGISKDHLDTILGDKMSPYEKNRFADEWNRACWMAEDAMEARRRKERKARIT